MNGKKGLSRIMSALLAAMSFVGQASAAPKKKTKEPNGTAEVLRDRKNRGRDKRGNGRGNKRGNKRGNERGDKRGEKLGLSSAEFRVVGLIKKHPKTSAGLGLAGLGAIGYGGYKIYNSKWNKYYREVFSEKNYDSCYTTSNLVCSERKICLRLRWDFSGGNLCELTLCSFDNGDSEKSFLSAIAMMAFLVNCFNEVLDVFGGDMSMVSKWGSQEFENFEDIEMKFCGKFPNYSQKIKEIVKFYSDFAGKYLGRLADKLLEYGEKENKKLVVGEGGAIKCVARST